MSTESGLVLRSTGAHYTVRLGDGRILECVLRGKFRLEGLKATNPVAVGDHVQIDPTELTIEAIEPRRNHILRQSAKRGRGYQILCANIDQAILVGTIEQPFTPLGYIDRFLVMCEAYHVPAVIVFNKQDLVLQDDKQLDKLLDFTELYEAIGYRVEHISSVNPNHIQKAAELLAGKVSFLAGKSGAGKSSLLNLVDPELDLRTQGLTKHSNKGRHTTTFAEMHTAQTPAGPADVIDAPGMNEFQVVELAAEELSHYYPEMRERLNDCKFRGCLHVQEPGCAVRAAVEEGSIATTRYNTYLSILQDVQQQPKY